MYCALTDKNDFPHSQIGTKKPPSGVPDGGRCFDLVYKQTPLSRTRVRAGLLALLFAVSGVQVVHRSILINSSRRNKKTYRVGRFALQDQSCSGSKKAHELGGFGLLRLLAEQIDIHGLVYFQRVF